MKHKHMFDWTGVTKELLDYQVYNCPCYLSQLSNLLLVYIKNNNNKNKKD